MQSAKALKGKDKIIFVERLQVEHRKHLLETNIRFMLAMGIFLQAKGLNMGSIELVSIYVLTET